MWKRRNDWLASLCVIGVLSQVSGTDREPAAIPGGFRSLSVPVHQPPGTVVQKGDIILVGDKITATKSGRTISFPAWVNQREGVVEYALVMRGGKVHEAIFATDADAKDLHITALLLDVSPESIVTKPTETWAVPAASAVE